MNTQTHTAPQQAPTTSHDAGTTDDLVEQARVEAERRLVEVDVEEARACGKTEAVVSPVVSNESPGTA